MDYKEEKYTAWEIIYSNYQGGEKQAVNLLNKELSRYLTRKGDKYTYFILPCNLDNGQKIEKNAFIIGTFDESNIVKEYVKKEEIPQNGYLVRVALNKDDKDRNVVIITAFDKRNLYYGVIEFFNGYVGKYAPWHGGLKVKSAIFDEILSLATLTSCPKTKTRGIFAWGHPINDYRKFFDNMAKQKLNEIIIWNDYVPINAEDVIEYAHSLDVKVIWGFAWGWSANQCSKTKDISKEGLEQLKKSVLNNFEKNYSKLNLDGIYFQSFTEMSKDNIDGVCIAKAVTDFVNDVSNELFNKNPKLRIQFGLHATSVKNHIEEIARVDKRIEILWEDCGAFPFGYTPCIWDEKDFDSTMEFVEKIMDLRKDAPVAFVVKGFMTLDWCITREEALKYGDIQRGRFVLGENHKDAISHDRRCQNDSWQTFYGMWSQYGEYVKRFTDFVRKKHGDNVALYMAGLFDDEIWLPEAVCSELFWDSSDCYKDIFCKINDSNFVKIF